MKKLVLILVLISVLIIFGGCSNDTVPNESHSAAASEMTRSEFLDAAYEMRYSKKQVEAITESRIPFETALDPLEKAPFVAEEKATANGKYALGSFDLNGKESGLDFVYVRFAENETPFIIDDYTEGTKSEIINDEYFFCYNPEKGLVIYSFEHLKAVEEWIPTSAEDKKYWESGFAFVPEEEKILIFGIETSPNFSFDAPLASDVAATYQIEFFDIKNGFSTVIDTGIEIHRDGYGEPADACFEDCPADDIDADFAFSICDRCYSLDFETLKVEMVHDHAFAEENYRFPPAPESFDISSADPILLSYYDWFDWELGYLGDYTEENGFAPKAMAQYTFHRSVEPDSEKYGVPKEVFIENSVKFFGLNVLELDSTYVDDGTGFIVPTFGYSPSPSAFVLKERTENPDGSVTAVFYHIGLDFYSQEFYDNVLRGASVDELLLSGQFGYFSDHIELFEVRFFERSDENGGFYAEFISAKNLGYVPENIYQIYTSEGRYPVYGS